MSEVICNEGLRSGLDSLFYHFYNGGTINSNCAVASSLENQTFPASAFTPKCIDRSDNVTVVVWEDGVKTTVRLPDDAGYDDPYLAFLSALGKRMFGSTSKLHKVVDTHQRSYINAQKTAAVEDARRKNREREEQNHNRKIRAMARQMRLKQEAEDYAAKHPEV